MATTQLYQKYQMWGLSYCYFVQYGEGIHLKNKGNFKFKPITLNPNITYSKNYIYFSLYFIKKIKGVIEYDTTPNDIKVSKLQFETLKGVPITLNSQQLILVGKRFLSFSQQLLLKSSKINLNLSH